MNGTTELPPHTLSLVWLFNIKTDPNERDNVVGQYPEKVLELRERIQYYNAPRIEQPDPPLDPRSNPLRFGGVWTPCIGDFKGGPRGAQASPVEK